MDEDQLENLEQGLTLEDGVQDSFDGALSVIPPSLLTTDTQTDNLDHQTHIREIRPQDIHWQR
jgi:hypothetical protein